MTEVMADASSTARDVKISDAIPIGIMDIVMIKSDTTLVTAAMKIAGMVVAAMLGTITRTENVVRE